jgi:class 3 adenylate cyclase
MERAVVGETPNVAARLQGEAGLNEVVIAPSTYRLVNRRFDVSQSAPRPLKGIDEPMPLLTVLGVRQTTRFAAAAGDQLTPLIGRDEELAMLERRWQLAAGGESQVWY